VHTTYRTILERKSNDLSAPSTMVSVLHRTPSQSKIKLSNLFSHSFTLCCVISIGEGREEAMNKEYKEQ
jgi:hypothetical protein